MASLRDRIQELRDLGLYGTIFRAGWEAKTRAGLVGRLNTYRAACVSPPPGEWTQSLVFEDGPTVARCLAASLEPGRMAQVENIAAEAAKGRIRCFGRWPADFGDPIRWHEDPKTKRRWDPGRYWSRALRPEPGTDIKFTWEVARFPQAFFFARAAALSGAKRDFWRRCFTRQVEAFIRDNPVGYGVHWFSGQEFVYRSLAWLFALDVLGPEPRLADLIGASLLAGAHHLESTFGYAKKAVYNNHLLAEALGFYLVGLLFPAHPRATHWRALGRQTLIEEAERQFYADGAYISHAHNYQRNAGQQLVLACVFARALDRVAPEWLAALARSLDFLWAHIDPQSGQLPNFGANDGSLPLVLSTCDFGDYRPLLQTLSLLTREERLFKTGPWDEEAAWLLGVEALQAPLATRKLRSRQFEPSGYYILRPKDGARHHATFRCGTLTDRFAQIDMLHVDYWRDGQNVLVDGGSFSYNGDPEWHRYFSTTASHNTVMLAGRDQMLAWRRFKNLYWTKARRCGWREGERYVTCAGEHDGYIEALGRRHRRALLITSEGLLVLDTFPASGPINMPVAARLHWLVGDLAHRGLAEELILTGSETELSLRVFGAGGEPLPLDVVVGQEDPPRGWVSRHYGEKVAVPSVVVESRTRAPVFLTVVGPRKREIAWVDDTLALTISEAELRFSTRSGFFASV